MFKELPRFMGFPNQTFVRREFAFNAFFRELNGVAPFFVSTYQFKDKLTPIVNCLVFDIDSNFGMRFPYNNTRALKKFCERHCIPYIINFSGGKGFHLFVMIKDIIPKLEEREALGDKIYSTQVAMCKLLNIESVDYPTFGRLHFLIRYPTGLYVRSKAKNGFYCRNLTPEEFDSGLTQISKMVTTPGTVPETPKATHTLDDIITLLPNYKDIERMNGEDTIELIRSEMQPPTVAAVGVPCLKEISRHAHPRHFERVELGSWLKFLGYTDLAIITFMKNQNWTRFDYSKTKYQVSTLKSRYPDCKKLKEAYGDMCENCILNLKRRKKDE